LLIVLNSPCSVDIRETKNNLRHKGLSMHIPRSRFRFRSFLIFATTASALMSVNACTSNDYHLPRIFDQNPPATAIPTKLMTVGRVLNTFPAAEASTSSISGSPPAFTTPRLESRRSIRSVTVGT
jgi:hypothetical protein